MRIPASRLRRTGFSAPFERVRWMAAYLCAALLAAGCGPRVEPVRSAEAAVEELSAGAQEAVSAVYRERLRLGLGSPFRLIHFALVDPRLDARSRAGLGDELLQRTARGEMYSVDPAALLPTLAPPTPARLAAARQHLALIEQAVGSTDDPRAGEMAVRLAYRLAHLEGTVDSLTLVAAVRVASLVRDRRFAQADARRLLRTARASGREGVELVELWRRERLLLVERPALQALAPQVEREAIELATRMLRSIRLIGLWPPAAGEQGAPIVAGGPSPGRVRAVPGSPSLPPNAAIVVALRWPALGGEAGVSVLRDPAWKRFAETAWNEESFAAGYPELVSRAPSIRTLAAKAALRAAVGLRPYAQEQPWLPGFAGPTVEELRARYGMRVEVDSGVPHAWRPYVLRTLDDALRELRTVLPTLRVHGLRVRIPLESSRADALALHTPGNRVLEWPVTTGAGTLAHEIAHDLDWQVSHRAGAPGSGYASDRAVARGRAPFADALLQLMPGTSNARGSTDDARLRPAEVLARNFDWFVVARLAAQGRWAGALSSAQDEVLTGYGGVSPPGPDEAYGPAVLAAIRPIAQVPEEERRAFLWSYGPGRWPTANLVVGATEEQLRGASRGEVESADLEGPARRLAWIAEGRDRMLRQLDGWLCRYASPLVDATAVRSSRALVREVAEARARAIAVEQAAELGGEEGRRWMLRELYGPLWPEGSLAPAAEAVLPALLSEVRALRDMPEVPLAAATGSGWTGAAGPSRTNSCGGAAGRG